MLIASVAVVAVGPEAAAGVQALRLVAAIASAASSGEVVTTTTAATGRSASAAAPSGALDAVQADDVVERHVQLSVLSHGRVGAHVSQYCETS